jgi:hypothetical protein
MNYICLGYMEPGKFEGMTEDEQHAVFDECFEYNDRLRANGHVATEVQEMRDEGLLRPTLVKPGENKSEQDAPALVNSSDDPGDLPF